MTQQTSSSIGNNGTGALWTFKTETCNGDKFYPLFRGEQQWGYANEKTFAELMVRALNRDMETTTAARQRRNER